MNIKKRKICVVTGSRAEFGLLYWLMKDIAADPDLQLQTVVTGAHLSSIHGHSVNEVKREFSIDAEVDMQIGDDSARGITKSLGIGIMGFGEVFQRLKPDIVVILGDRYEILGVAQAALIARIPLAHIQGGEITQGAFDESIRHAITKMSQFHFTTAEENTRRVVQMGENPEHVYTLGAPGLDNISRLKLLTRSELEKEISFSFGEINFAVTYHPVTLSSESPQQSFQALLDALLKFENAKFIFTKPNADTNSRIIAEMIDQFVQKYPQKSCAHASLGQLRYLSLLKHVDAVVGNSSSGILEAPSMKVPTVNIGDRQKGRLCAKSVIHCGETREEIESAIRQAISPNFRKLTRESVSPYHCDDISGKIKNTLKKVSLDNVVMKQFFELGNLKK